jgi:CxxC-x17-CxxC domain-containing protein
MHEAPGTVAEAIMPLVRGLVYVMIVLAVLEVAIILLKRQGRLLIERLAGGRVKRARTLEEVITRDGVAFERLCVELFAAKGYRARRTGGQSDGGVDLVAVSDAGKVLVQCKARSDRAVGVKVVREMLGVVNKQRAQRGYVITTSRFTKDAVGFARNEPITLMDREAFLREVRTHLPQTLISEAVAEPAAPVAAPVQAVAAPPPAPSPTPAVEAPEPAAPAEGYPITCSECGASDTVPFEPRPGKKLVCRACYAARRSGRARVSSATP